jgi:hypothetical protein
LNNGVAKRQRGDAEGDQKEQIEHDCHIHGERDDFERDLLRHPAQEEACLPGGVLRSGPPPRRCDKGLKSGHIRVQIIGYSR